VDLNWIAVGAVATVIAALATAILAGATYWLAKTTRDELQQTKREITATERQADASTRMIAEVQMDRDLNWRPYLVIDKTSWAPHVRGHTDKVWLQNIGRGPAFNATCARLYHIPVDRAGVVDQVPQWRLAIELPATIESAGVQEFSLQDWAGTSPVPLVLFVENPPPQPTVSIFYQDIVGKRAYRLTFPRSAPDMWTPGDKVEQWVSWYFGHIGLQVPTQAN
jgi:hypothetical protein